MVILDPRFGAALLITANDGEGSGRMAAQSRMTSWTKETAVAVVDWCVLTR
jgi:hypothetical protein